MEKTPPSRQPLINTLAHPRIVFWVLPLLMIVLIAGTIAQKEIGLYAAQEQYFSSFIIWFGPLPFPGGILLTAIFALNLLVKFIYKSTWSWMKAGSIITHLGVLLLLIGGLLTALTAKEGYLVIPEGTTVHEVEDYHQRNLAIRLNNQMIFSQPFEKLKEGQTIEPYGATFVLNILTLCENCTIQKRAADKAEGWTSPGKFMQLLPAPPDPQDERNMTGIEFKITGAGAADGKYLTFDKFPKPPQITAQMPQVTETGTYTITVERARRPLPFSVKLDKFTRNMNKGSEMERDFISDLTITDGANSWGARLAMNEPVRLKGYTIYQSSFDMTGPTPQTVLSVVENKGQVFPYIASLVMAFGLILHLVLRLKDKRSKIAPALGVIAAIILTLTSAPSQARVTGGGVTTIPPQPLESEKFMELPIFHEGRLKPMATFAELTLKKFAGRTRLKTRANINEGEQEIGAAEWLMMTLFDPVRSSMVPVFDIPDPTTRHALSLIERPSTLYSFEELAEGLNATTEQVTGLMDKPPKNLAPNEKDLLRVHENAAEFVELMRSLSLFLPLAVDISEDVRAAAGIAPESPITFKELSNQLPELQQKLKKIIARKGEDPKKYAPSERALALLSWQLSTIAESAGGNDLLKVIPLDWSGPQAKMVAPWSLLAEGLGSPETAPFMKDWANLTLAYQMQDTGQWEATLTQMQQKTENKTLSPAERERLRAERLFNTLKPFQTALILFALTFLLGLVTLAFPRTPLIWGAWLSASAAILLQTTGLGWRVYILDRPPVGTLYESLLFVGLISPLIAIILERRFKNGTGLLLAGLSGTALGLMAMTMMGEDDNFKMLTAVLNTRFWLMTHVLCITIGYGWCLMTALLAHGLLWAEGTPHISETAKNRYRKPLEILVLTSLLFTAIGTILGGIWADQSWGRFWGWDPKENGALLIVLWLAWVIHGRIAGQITSPLWMAGLAFVGVIVAFAWIGVNLLGVGLHSYGFTEGVFWGLGLFTGAEILLITILVLRARLATAKILVREGTNKEEVHAA
ncbi:MAG: cytochrome c biogenesis protein CcsA [Pseudobdellovibrionaceae bacterium]